MANFVYIENNQIIEYHDLLPESWQHISGLNLLEDTSMLNSLGWYSVTEETVSFDPTQQYINGYTYNFDGTTVTQTPVLSDINSSSGLTPDQILAEQFLMVRNKRDELIAESDWTELPSVQAIHDTDWKTSWATYRQQLRDIPNQAESGEINIYEVTWPSAPAK